MHICARTRAHTHTQLLSAWCLQEQHYYLSLHLLSAGHRLRSFYCYLQIVFTYYGTPGLGPPDTGLQTLDLSRPTSVLYVASGVLANAYT